MNDPLPENIEGSKRVTHTVEHRVNWGYVSVAIAVLVVAWVGYSAIGGSGGLEEQTTREESY